MPSVTNNIAQFILAVTVFGPQKHLFNPRAKLSHLKKFHSGKKYTYLHTFQHLKALQHLLSSLLKSFKELSLDKCYFQ